MQTVFVLAKLYILPEHVWLPKKKTKKKNYNVVPLFAAARGLHGLSTLLMVQLS